MDRRLFLSIAAISACGPRHTTRLPVRLAVGGAAQLVYMPVTLCRQLGHFEEEGLDVEFQDFAGGAKALQALLGGSADVVSGFYDHTIQMAADGRKLVAFVNVLRYPGLVLVVSPKTRKPISRVDDLTGTTAGVTAPGSSTHFFLNYLMAKRNVAAESVSVVGIGHGPAALAAVESGQVDVGVLTDPALSQLQLRSQGVRILADTRLVEGVREIFGVEEYPASVLYAGDAWLKSNGEAAQRLAKAMKRTLAWMAGHTSDQIVDRLPAGHIGSDRALYRDALEASLGIYNPNGILSAEGAQAVRKVLGYSLPKVRESQIDLAATFTNEFVTEF
jgi:NitT/TauT family transport system substrate-binding protein